MDKVLETKLNNILIGELQLIKNSNESVEEQLKKVDTIANLKKILDNYDELDPILRTFFADKANKEKWKNRNER